MNPINLNLLGSQVVSNNLYDTLSPDWLDEDLVFVLLPDGSCVDVGWYGKLGDGGYFKILRYQTSWNSPIETARTDDVREVAKILKQLSEKALISAVQAVPGAAPAYCAALASPTPAHYVRARVA